MFYTLLKIQQFFEALYRTLISLLRVLFRMRFVSGFKKVEIPAGDIFIMANGPSLRQDLDRFGPQLASSCTLGLNMFALSDDFVLIKPKYYVLLDIGFFIEETIPRVKEARDKVMESLKKSLNWKMAMFIPIEGKNSFFHQELVESKLPLEFVFFNRTVIDGLGCFRNYMYSRGLGMPPPQNVLIGAIMVAIQIGFKKIYLIGADHSWHRDLLVDNNGDIEIVDRHFYDQKSTRLKVLHPETLQRSGMHEIFGNLALTFRSYHLIAGFAKSRGIEILNASSVSYIDAFERINLDDLPWDHLLDK